MIIDRNAAIDAITRGDAYFDGLVFEDDRIYWIITDIKHQRIHHLEIDGDEPLTGCADCGGLVMAAEDAIGCGMHCPNCDATL